MGGNTVDRTFEGQPDAVFESYQRAAANCGFSVLSASRDALTISFNTGRSSRTVGGQDLTASIFDEGGSCWVVGGGGPRKAEISMAVHNLRRRRTQGSVKQISG